MLLGKQLDFLELSLLSLLKSELFLSELNVVSLGVSLGLGLDLFWVLSDALVELSVELLDGFDLAISEGLVQLGELSLEDLSVAGLEGLHVVIDVLSEDSVSVDGWLVLLGSALGVDDLSWESGDGVWDIESSIGGSLQDGENSVSDSGSGKTDIQNSLEWSSFVIGVFRDIGFLSGDVVDTWVEGIHLELLEQSSGQQQSGGVGGWVAGQSGVDSPSLELSGGGAGEDSVSLQGGVDDLGDDVSVGDSSDQSVLGGVVLILILEDQSLSGIVVGFSLSSSSELGLVSLEVSGVLNKLDEGHL